MKKQHKEGTCKVLGRSVVFSAFYADFCVCYKLVIITTISDSMILLFNSLPIHSVNHKHRQTESHCMSENMCLCKLCGFIVIMGHPLT